MRSRHSVGDFAGGGSAMHWADVIDRHSSGEMPPEDEAAQIKTADYKLPAIIEALVLSDLFQKR